MKVYGFVPAKGTSERIENKNKRFLDGDMLYVKAVKTLLKCKEIDKVFLDISYTSGKRCDDKAKNKYFEC